MNAALEEAIERSADPPAVARTIESLDVDRIETDPDLRAAIVTVAGASRFLSRLLLADEQAIEVLAHLGTRPGLADLTNGDGDVDVDALARWKRLEMLRIAGRDLVGLDPLEAVGANLAYLAEDVLRGAWRLGGEPALAVIGMGKLGASELNYASDVDVVFVGEGDARALLDAARSCFRVDADLRPEGRSGALVRSVASYEAYWDRWAEPWEFQALLKARAVAGDPALGVAFEIGAADRVWNRPFGADELRSVRAMKARAEGEMKRRRLSDREVKRGRGGIRDIEFAVQLLQLVHGRQDPALRLRPTLPALDELAIAGYIDPEDASSLEDAYRFLRTVEHRLQLVEDQQVHAVPADPTARSRLARTMGYRDDEEATALARFDDKLREHQATARAIHERLYFRPLLEAFTSDGAGAMPIAAVEARLAAFGFRDADRTRQAVRELTRGLTRSSRLMQQLLPLLLGWLSDAPDPDLGLLGLRNLVGEGHRSVQLVAEFRESTETARRLCLLLGTSRRLATSFEHNPEVIGDLSDDNRLVPRSRRDMVEAVATALTWRSTVDERRLALYRLKQTEELRIAARDVLGLDDVHATGASLTALADAALEAALATLQPSVPMALIALGRFGGGELSYASDLDIVLAYEGSTSEDFAAAEATATALLRFVNGATPAMRVYRLDMDLRPEGKQGPLARSLDGFRVYYQRWAQTWERQALVRARAAAGDAGVGQRFMALVDEFAWGRPFTNDERREVRRMKARVERERIPAGEDPQFHLKLGRGSLSDVEWTAQLLQLQHGVRATSTIGALESLVGVRALDANDARVLTESYRFCELARNHLFLVRGDAGDSLPTSADQLGKLARSLGTTGPELRDEYRRVTRRARAVVERVFYGSGG